MRQHFRTLQQLFELCGHLRTRHIVTHHAVVLLAYHGVDVIQGLVRVGKSCRVCPPRLSSRCRAALVMASQTTSMERKSMA